MNTATQELVTANVTVQYVNEPKDGRKTGSIRGTDGIYYGAWPDKLRMFEEGETYEISYKENNGFRNIVAAKRLAAQPQRRPQQQQDFTTIDVSNPQPAPIPRQQPQRPVASPPANGYYRPTAPRDAERMFVCATLGHFIAAGRAEWNEDDLVARVNMLRSVWQRTFGDDDAAA